ncbi:MAG: hypothetical protein EBX53_02965 [Betaproteobacteria bacterium]|nr:hypothetical protein [Betaproteobacteria bacterium]NDB13371.1 hypothetical protein [Betaproteobacteria bacterium]
MRKRSSLPKVLSIDWDGLFVSVEFTIMTGERVSAVFRFEQWVQPPNEVLGHLKIILDRGWFSIAGPLIKSSVRSNTDI